MDKLVAFFKNVWLRRGVALLCWGYTAMLVWLAWLNFAYHFEFENPTSLFVLYLFINIAALGLMIYTRKQVITMINCMVLPPIVFVSVILGFGSWYMLIPPLVVVIAMFFICAANETLKTVLGTMYLLMYVIGVVAYVVINLLMGRISFTDVDLSLRDSAYEKLSPDGEYRIVRYIDDPSKERRTASYYIEYTGDDVEIPFGICKKVLGCQRVLTTKFNNKTDDPVFWTTVKANGEDIIMINVEGVTMENPYLKEVVPDTESEPDTTTKSTTASKSEETSEPEDSLSGDNAEQ